MKIEARRLFAHPVLAEGRDDYKTCKFSAEMKPSVDAAGNLIFDVNLSTDCAEINRLLAGGDAEYLFHAECPATIYRQVFARAVGEFVCKIPSDLVKDKIYLAAAYRRRKLNFNDMLASEDSLALAQSVMGLPLTKALKSFAAAFDDAAEDS